MQNQNKIRSWVYAFFYSALGLFCASLIFASAEIASAAITDVTMTGAGIVLPPDYPVYYYDTGSNTATVGANVTWDDLLVDNATLKFASDDSCAGLYDNQTVISQDATSLSGVFFTSSEPYPASDISRGSMQLDLYDILSSLIASYCISVHSGHDFEFPGFDVINYVAPPPPPPMPEGPIADLASSSNAAFTATVGFSVGGALLWVQDNLIKLFIGSGIEVLYVLRFWIVAFAMISSIVYFAFAAFRFFRH